MSCHNQQSQLCYARAWELGGDGEAGACQTVYIIGDNVCVCVTSVCVVMILIFDVFDVFA